MAENKSGYPDFTDDCPLCHGKNCAVRIGFYTRKTIVIGNTTYKNVAIPRWRCSNKGQITPKHRTFSLLPYMLIPHHKHDINLLFETVDYHTCRSRSLEDTKDFIIEQAISDDIYIENSQLYEFNTLFSQALIKLNSIPVLQQKIKPCRTSNNPFLTLIRFISGYQSPMEIGEPLLRKSHSEQMSNAEKLALDYFYLYQTGDYFQRGFLDRKSVV